MSNYIEAELILPALYIISSQTTPISTAELISELRILLRPDGNDLNILAHRKDDRFSQIVRNLVSHKTLSRLGYADFENGSFSITEEGISYLNEPDNQKYISEFYIEDIEGLNAIEEDDNETISIYPNGSLNIEKVQFSVYELKRKSERQKLILDPSFQRENVWNSKQQSELIESVLMNIPLPFIYLSENKTGGLLVVDGRQRLTALFKFINGEFRLHKGLKILKNIAGKKFNELDSLLQGVIEDYQLTTYVIKPPTSDRVMIDIFDRVNRSGTILNNQEIRNALYQGKSTELLTELSETDEFKLATDNSVKGTRMRDKYIILRFLSFYIWRTEFYKKKDEFEYKGDTEDFLGKYMDYMNQMTNDRIANLSFIFKSAMKNSYTLFGTEGFRLPNKKNLNKKRPINMALFESLGYLLSHQKCMENKEWFKNQIETLLEKEEFINSFLSIDGTVKYRFDEMDKILIQCKW